MSEEIIPTPTPKPQQDAKGRFLPGNQLAKRKRSHPTFRLTKNQCRMLKRTVLNGAKRGDETCLRLAFQYGFVKPVAEVNVNQQSISLELVEEIRCVEQVEQEDNPAQDSAAPDSIRILSI